MTPESFNTSVFSSGLWKIRDLTREMQNAADTHGVGSEEFAATVKDFQRTYDITPIDGKLGSLTLEGIKRASAKGRILALPEVGWPSELGAKAPSERKVPKRRKKIQYVIVHTTGSGVYSLAARSGKNAFDAAVSYYRGPTAYTSHFVAGLEAGQFTQIVSLEEIAFHAGVGTEGALLYNSGTWRLTNYTMGGNKVILTPEQSEKYYSVWDKTWKPYGITNPLKLTNKDPNGTSVGFDLLAYPYGGTYSDWQYACLAKTCIYLKDHYGMPLDRRHILTHSDTHPIQRSNSSGGWDPGAQFSYDKLFSVLATNQS